MIVQQRPWTQAKPGSRVLVGMQLFRDEGEGWNNNNMGCITSLIEVKPRSVSFYSIYAFLFSNQMYFEWPKTRFCNVSILKEIESQPAVHKCSREKLLLKLLHDQHKNTCSGVCFLVSGSTLLKRDSAVGVFLRTSSSSNFSEQFFCKAFLCLCSDVTLMSLFFFSISFEVFCEKTALKIWPDLRVNNLPEPFFWLICRSSAYTFTQSKLHCRCVFQRII